MKHIHTVWLFGIGSVVIAATATGFWIGARTTRFEATSGPLLRLDSQVAALRATVAESLQRVGEVASRRSTTEPVNLAGMQPLIEQAVERVLEHQTKQARAEVDARLQPTNESLQAYAQGEHLVDEALKSTEWTEARAQSLRRIQAQLTSEQAASLAQRLAVAVNEGKLAIQTDGIPF